MKLYISKGTIKSIGDLTMDEIEYVSNNFPFPAITTGNLMHTASNDLIDEEMFTIYLSENQLTEHVRAILQNRAISDLEEEMVYAESFPMELVGGYRYFMDVTYANNFATSICLGCEVLLADNWKEICTNDKYKRYFEREEKRGFLQKNLTQMLANYSTYGAICWTAEEHYLMQNVITSLLEVA